MWTLDSETRRRYVHGMIRLGVWYVCNLLERGKVRPDDLPVALCKRVDLYRLTDIWNRANYSDDGLADPRWVSLATEIAGWVRATPFQAVDEVEERVLALLEPGIQERLPKDVGPPPVRPFECWTYELGWPGLAMVAAFGASWPTPCISRRSCEKLGLATPPFIGWRAAHHERSCTAIANRQYASARGDVADVDR